MRDFLGTYPPGLRFLYRIETLRREVEKEPNVVNYGDLAISPIAEEYNGELNLFNATRSAREVADRALSRGKVYARAN